MLDQAEMELKKSIELQPSYFAFSNLGIVYYQQKRWSDAAAIWNKALQLNRSDFRVWANLALAYEWLDQKPQAENAYREELSRLEPAARLKPDDPALQCELGLLYSTQHLRSKAIPLIQAALARAPQDPAVLSCAGETYNTLGDQQKALTYFASALQNGLPVSELEQSPTLHKLLADPKLQMARANGGARPNRP